MKYHALLTTNSGPMSRPTNPCKLLDFTFLKLECQRDLSARTAAIGSSWQ